MKKYLRRPFHTPDYEIISDCPEFLESLCLQYGGYICDTASQNPYRITVKKEKNSGYIFKHTAGKSVTDKPLLLFDDILFETTVYDEKILPLHGAAVEYGGRAYIFLAPTTSGKTTLTAYLTHNGLGYITEDTAIVDKNTFEIYPYPCPVHLRAGGIDVLKKYGINIPDIKILETHAGTRHIYTPENCVTTKIPLGRIFFIERSESENRIIDIPVNESVMELMKSGMTVYNPTAGHLKLISKLAGMGCKRLIYKDMEYVKDMIINGHIDTD